MSKMTLNFRYCFFEVFLLKGKKGKYDVGYTSISRLNMLLWFPDYNLPRLTILFLLHQIQESHQVTQR